jgi:hypothetical protein
MAGWRGWSATEDEDALDAQALENFLAYNFVHGKAGPIYYMQNNTQLHSSSLVKAECDLNLAAGHVVDFDLFRKPFCLMITTRTYRSLTDQALQWRGT